MIIGLFNQQYEEVRNLRGNLSCKCPQTPHCLKNGPSISTSCRSLRVRSDDHEPQDRTGLHLIALPHLVPCHVHLLLARVRMPLRPTYSSISQISCASISTSGGSSIPRMKGGVPYGLLDLLGDRFQHGWASTYAGESQSLFPLAEPERHTKAIWMTVLDILIRK